MRANASVAESRKSFCDSFESCKLSLLVVVVGGVSFAGGRGVGDPAKKAFGTLLILLLGASVKGSSIFFGHANLSTFSTGTRRYGRGHRTLGNR